MIFPVFVMPVVLVAALVYAQAASAGSWGLSHLTTYLASVVKQNLPLGSSISAYAQDMPAWRFWKQRMLVGIADRVDSGWFLADALDLHPGYFPPYYRALVRSAENAGNLGVVLDRLAETADADARAGARVTGASLYPAALCLMAFALTSLIIVLIVPKFWHMFSEISGDAASARRFLVLPITARTLSWVALIVFGGLGAWGLLLPTGLLGQVTPLHWIASRLKWYVPFLSRYERRRAASQYALVAGRLLEAGIATHEALRVAASASANEVFDRVAAHVADLAEEGRPLSDALKAADPGKRLPRELAWYVEVGERSGRLPEALARASDVCAARSRNVLSRLTGLIFPLGVITVALVVGMLGYGLFKSLVLLMEEAWM